MPLGSPPLTRDLSGRLGAGSAASDTVSARARGWASHAARVSAVLGFTLPTVCILLALVSTMEV